MKLVPIRVGMIFLVFCVKIFAEACPHTRGDDPVGADLHMKKSCLSPYAWG